MIELMSDKQSDFLHFLLSGTDITLSSEALAGIDSVLAFQQGSNPDGRLRLLRYDGVQISVFLEIKTHRRSLDLTQLQAHVNNHVARENNALLLVITPRPGDSIEVKRLNDHRLLFISWQDIADFLTKCININSSDSVLIEHFLAYADEEGEFVCTELEKQDIELLINYLARKPDKRIRGAFDRLAAEFDFSRFFNPGKPPYWTDAWGRKGIDIEFEYDVRWITFGIYYDISDHAIPFLQGVPELALFVYIKPELRKALSEKPEFLEALGHLEELCWQENLTKKRTTNEWLLIWWRQPLNQLSELNGKVLSKILTDRLNELTENNEFLRPYLA